MKYIDNGRRMETPRQPEWLVAVEQSMETAPDLIEAELRDEQIGAQIASFIAGNIDGLEYRRLDKEHSVDTRGQLRFTNVEEFGDAIEWVLRKFSPGYSSSEYKAKTLELRGHEEEHFDEAEKYDLENILFIIRFFREGNTVSFRPGITFELPENLGDDELRDLLRKIITAPEELSDLDQGML